MDSNLWFCNLEPEVYAELLTNHTNTMIAYWKKLEQRMQLQKEEDEAYEACCNAIDKMNALGASMTKPPRS